MASELARRLREELERNDPPLQPAIDQLKALNEELAAQNEFDREDDAFTPVTFIESLHRNGRVPR